MGSLFPCLASEKMWENFKLGKILEYRNKNVKWKCLGSLSLSLSLLSSCDLSLGCVACVRVYGCLAVGLGIAILVGMWPYMYVDVNECNVCSVCMFLIWDFGFIFSYCGGCENGFARSKACHSYSFYSFSVLPFFVS